MKKKVLIFIEDGSFSFDNRVKRHVEALLNDNWNLVVISPKYYNDPFYKKVNERLILLFYPKPNMHSNIGHVFEHLTSLIFGVLYTFIAFIMNRFNIFHACNPTDILWIVYLPYKIFGVKFIFDQHDLSPEVYLSRPNSSKEDYFFKILIWLEKKSYQLAHRVIATNESYFNMAITRGRKNKNHITIVRNGPLLEKYNLEKIIPKQKELGVKLVGYVGNINVQDGVDEIVHFADIIKNHFNRTDIKFIIIGGGANQENLVKLTKSMNLENIIYFTGRISDIEMLSTLASCDLCIQPDPYNPLNDVSTMNKIMEYMALSKSFVAYDLKETKVSGGSCGLYANINDRNDFVAKIIYLLDNPQKTAELGRLGRKRIEKSLAWNYSAEKLIQLYNDCLIKNV